MANPQAELQTFRISTKLKDLIGRDLITDDFVAVFELVKNAFDAHATVVKLHFDEDRLVISDNGKGMSRSDILNKWLFVAYSAKRDGTEDDNYRDLIEDRKRPFAGAKGVGRFSCDRLGKSLLLSSRAQGSPVQHLSVDWTRFEQSDVEEFSSVDVELTETAEFFDIEAIPSGVTGTVLTIRHLRSSWDREKLRSLKRELSKLIDPFSDEDLRFNIFIEAPAERGADEDDQLFNEEHGETHAERLIVNGAVRNPILDVLSSRTTSIEVCLANDGEWIESTLIDRGELIYQLREKNPFHLLSATGVRATIYYLNRSAKYVFARRMGLPSVQFGSVFLFRNGFRVFPIGAEDDDFFGLNRRKQQGQRRYLGGRDLIGRVDITGSEGFSEATSRNQGLIRTDGVEELIEFVREKCVVRLERYIVDISWKDIFDKDLDSAARMKLDSSSVRVTQLVSRLAATNGIELLAYNPELVRIVDEKSNEFQSSLRALEVLAERTGDSELLSRVEQARVRISALENAEREAREAEQRATSRAAEAEEAARLAEQNFAEELTRNRFLVAAASLDQDTILNLHHQIIIHASDVHNEIKLLMGQIRRGHPPTDQEWIDALERMSYRNSQILTAAKFATKGGYKQQSAEVEDNLPLYIQDYVKNVSSLWSRQQLSIRTTWDGTSFIRKFKPIDLGILIDNVVSNAEKAGAANVVFEMSVCGGTSETLDIEIADDGDGWPKQIRPIERLFEKGVTSKATGSGLGLFHVKQVIEAMGGAIEVLEEPLSPSLDGAHIKVRLPK